MRPIDELTGLTIEAILLLTEERDKRERHGLDEEAAILDKELDRLMLTYDPLPLPTTFEGDDVDVWIAGMEYGMKWAALAGAGAKYEKLWKSRMFCCIHATKIWKKDAETPIPDVLAKLKEQLDAEQPDAEQLDGRRWLYKEKTIRLWLKEAEESGVIVIPPALKTRKR